MSPTYFERVTDIRKLGYRRRPLAGIAHMLICSLLASALTTAFGLAVNAIIDRAERNEEERGA